MAENIKKLTMRNCCIDEDGRTDEPIIKKMNEVIDFINLIDIAPVRHGRWEEASDGDGIVCPFCRTDFCTLIYDTEYFNYCPHCGAKMDLEG